METKDILQVNATLIAGAFIFLSLSIAILEEPNTNSNLITLSEEPNSTNGNFPNPDRQNNTSNNKESTFQSNTQSLVAFLVIVPFSVSSFVAIIAHWEKHKSTNYEGLIKGSLVFMIMGFFMLFGVALAAVTGIIVFLD